MNSNRLIIHKKFHWSGINTQGNTVAGEINAVTINHAKLKLSRQGIVIHAVYKKNIFNYYQHGKRISPTEIMVFFRQLATLVNAGVSILQSCDILFKTQHNPALQALITTLKMNIAAGKGLARGMRQFPLYFDDLTCHLIQAGEQSGTFAIMLTRIALYKEKMHHFKNNIKQALFYPTIISIIAIIISIIMLTLIVPRFAELFQSMHSQLPAITLAVITLSEWIRYKSWLILFPLFLLIPLRSYFMRTARFKLLLELLLIKTPVMTTVYQKIVLANFARNLSILFSAGVPIMDAIKIIAPASGHSVYQQALLDLQNEISKGQQLHHAMQKNALFSILLIQMIKIGEETGALEQMLEKIAELYEAETDHLISKLSHLLEPLIMVILGVLIGGLVIAMYLPIFKLGTVL